jgi:hypothetical protein
MARSTSKSIDKHHETFADVTAPVTTPEAPAVDINESAGVFNQGIAATPVVPNTAEIIHLRTDYPTHETRTNAMYPTREAWLEGARDALRRMFAKEGVTLPANVRVSLSKPSAKRLREGNGGELLKGELACTIGPKNSADGHFEVFIAAQANGDEDLIFTLAGQLLRTLVWDTELETKNGYSKRFIELASQFGLKPEGKTGKMNLVNYQAAVPFTMIARELGEAPYAKINTDFATTKAKSATRASKCSCANEACSSRQTNAKEDPYTLRISGVWYDRMIEARVVLPICPFCASTLTLEKSEHEEQKAIVAAGGKATMN